MKTILSLLCSVFIALSVSAQSMEIDLAGTWNFGLDASDVGIKEGWCLKPLPDTLTLPGSLQEQGFGNLPSKDTQWTSGIGMGLLGDPRFADYINSPDFQCPFWLTPERHYVGAAWYQREIEIPEDWKGQRVVLRLERPHWQTMVWLNGNLVGTQDSLGMAHEYDLTKFAKAGNQRLAIRVDNRYIVPVGKDAHSISDQTQSNWNGIAGAIHLSAEPTVWFDDVQIYPDIDNHQIKTVIQVGNLTGVAGQGILRMYASPKEISEIPEDAGKSWPVEWNVKGGTLEFLYEMDEDCKLWDEYHPNLYHLYLELSGNNLRANQTISFGMRKLGIDGKQFTINDRRIFLRGTLECCIFPEHGYPPTDINEWKRIIGIAKDYGLNHFRFHSWCPPEAAFMAADEEGFYLQAEASCWASFGDGSDVDRWIYQECDRMLKAYGNHPSFILMSPSNEPGGKNRDRFLGGLVNYLKQKDSRRFYTAGTGWPQIPENQYDIQYETRLQNWPTLKFDRPAQTWDDYREYVEKRNRPTISHEIGQWCAYPDLQEDSNYQGVLKGDNIAIFRDKLEKAGMGHLAYEFLMASGKFQTLLYKQEIEAALRTPGFGGFQLLDLHDFPGQGTAPVGVLNALWQSKGYVNAEHYRNFCNDIVPLLRMRSRIFTNQDIFQGAIDIANYSAEELRNIQIECVIRNQTGQILSSRTYKSQTIPTGGLTRIGTFDQTLQSIQQASQLNVNIKIFGMPFSNDWDIWVYPKSVEMPSTPILITQDWKAALDKLQAGGDVLLIPHESEIASDTLGTFRPIFWNRITFPSQVEHTVGMICEPSHPALADFPTDMHSNWQWQDLLDHSKPMVMDQLPFDLLPIVQPIDDWNECRKLGLLFEVRIGSGRLLVCAMDIQNDLDQRIVARQLRYSLIKYMSSETFQPEVELSIDEYRSLFKEHRLMQTLGASARADSQQSGFEAEKAIDGNPTTFWHTRWEPSADAFPHELTIDLKKTISITGLTYLPRQDMSNGRIAQYEILVSGDGTTWDEPIATGTWMNDSKLKTIRFKESHTSRFLKLRALGEVNHQAFASAAEIEIVTN